MFLADSMKIAFYTLGCKLNFSETSAIARDFAMSDHYDIMKVPDKADIYVINSCSVTHNAERKCRELIRRLRRQNPVALVAVIGCYSQIKPRELGSAVKVDMVLGSQEKFRLFDIVEQYRNNGILQNCEKRPEFSEFFPAWSGDDRTRKFLKIQDGCDYGCSYCIVPLARGGSRSDTTAATIDSVKKLAAGQVKELVLTGVNIGDFGKQHNETFLGLLNEIDKVKGIERIRLSSVEPDLLYDDIIKLVADSVKIMPHFHIPLQSGSDKVLKEMGRKYDTRLFARNVEHINSLMPLACIAVDVIAGFPTETGKDFKETVSFIENLPISYMHVFTFSKRENTPAAGLEKRFHSSEKSYRSNSLKELSKKKLNTFYRLNKGRGANVLFESNTFDGFISGFTSNYVRVKTPYSPDLQNNICKVLLTDFSADMQFDCKIL